MTANEFKAAFKICRTFSIDLSNVDDSPLDGSQCPGFTPVFVTLEQVAKCLRYATTWIYSKEGDDSYDTEELARCRYALVTLRRAIITNSPESDKKLLHALTQRLLNA